MNELSPIRNLKNLKKDMENMSYKEKLVHIWTYYKWVLVVIMLLIMGASILISVIQNKRRILMLGGVTVNVQVSEEGGQYIQEDYLELVTTGNKRENVIVSHMDVDKPDRIYGDNYVAVKSLLALCTNEEVDYLILDQTGFETMLIHGAYLGLDQVYTQEELDAFGDKLVYAQMKDEATPSAVALDITDCAFLQEHANESGKVYFVYVINSPRVEECRAFYDYLMAYE